MALPAPSNSATTKSTVPVEVWDGSVTVISSSDCTLTTAPPPKPPNVTELAVLRSVPWTVMISPPRIEPLDGVMPVTVGTGGLVPTCTMAFALTLFEPIAVSVTVYFFTVFDGLGGNVAVVVAVPLVQGSVAGRPETGFLVAKEHVVAPLTLAVSTTMPPTFGSTEGTESNEEIVVAGGVAPASGSTD